MYRHTDPTPTESRAEGIPEVTLTEFPGNSFILCYCGAGVTNIPPTPSNWYVTIPFFREFTFILFTPENGRCIYHTKYQFLKDLVFSNTTQKIWNSPSNSPAQKFLASWIFPHDPVPFEQAVGLSVLVFFFPSWADKKKLGNTNSLIFSKWVLQPEMKLPSSYAMNWTADSTEKSQTNKKVGIFSPLMTPHSTTNT